MTRLGQATELPDPSWTAAELLERAEGCTSLSAAWLVPLADLDPADLSSDERASLAFVLQRITAVTEAIALRALGEFPVQACQPSPALRSARPEAAARMCPGGFGCRHYWQLDAFSAITGLPKWHTDHRYGFAVSLSGDWRPLWQLLATGRITLQHLEKFDRAVSDANPEALAAAVLAAVAMIGDSNGVSADHFARTARKAVARHTDPAEALVKQRDRARELAGVTVEPLCDGLAALTITAETHKIEAIHTLIKNHPAITHPAEGDNRTRGQREADLLISLCLLGTGTAATSGLAAPYAVDGMGGARDADSSCSASPGSASPTSASQTSGDSPSAGVGRSAVVPWASAEAFIAGWPGSAAAAEPAVGVIITASMETLLGLSNEPGTVGETTVSAALIRQWAADPTWVRRAILNHHGQVATVSPRQRFPAGLLAAAVRARWPRCTFPGCHRAARAAQLDHADPHANGGDTTMDNLHPLCPKHHLCKDQAGFNVRLSEDGTAIWTLPGNRTIRVPAPDHRPTLGRWDNHPDDDWRSDPPPWNRDDHMTGRRFEAEIAKIIALDHENRAA